MDTDLPRVAPKGLSNLLGPYEAWMFGPGRTYDLQGLLLADQTCLSCVAEYPHQADRARIDSAARPGRARYTVPVLYRPNGFIPSFVPFLLNGVASGPHVLAEVEAVDDALAGFLPAPESGEAARGFFRLNFPVRAETLDARFPSPAAEAPAMADPDVDPARPLVIAAIIDDGIPFAHGAFRQEGRTRIDYCWTQGARPEGTANGAVPFGREFTRETIDRLVLDCGGDEDEVYRRAGVLSRPGLPPMPLDLAQSHGAHVLDLAAGRWPAADAAQVRVIAVDLPPTSTWETSGYGTDMFILSALHYIFDRAARIAASYGLPDGLPVVVNLSFGYSGGPHDRSGVLEAAMDDIILARRAVGPTALVMPSGNSFQDRLTALVGNDDFRPGAEDDTEVAEVQWHAPASDGTSSFLELWYPPGTDRSDIRVEVIAPGCSAPANTAPLVERETGRFAASDLRLDGHIVGQFAVEKHRDSRWRVSVILAPTEPHALPPEAGHSAAASGTWTIRLVRPRGRTMPDLALPDGRFVQGAIQCRVQIDTASLQGDTGARQSAFMSSVYRPVDDDGAAGTEDGPGPVRRFGSLNGLAANRSALVVGGTDEATGQAAAYSGAGALRALAPDGGLAPVGRQVELSAPTDRSGWSEGILAAGTRTGIRMAMRGTSVAAPQAARRLIAALLDGEAWPPGDDTGLSLFLRRSGELGDPVTKQTGPRGQPRLGRLRLHPLSREV